MENASSQPALRGATSVCIAASDYREMVLTLIATEYGGQRHAAKRLARAAKSSYRTAQAWLSGRKVPSGHHFMNLLQECEAMAEAIKRKEIK